MSDNNFSCSIPADYIERGTACVAVPSRAIVINHATAEYYGAIVELPPQFFG
jgi:hypothetical protein